jgi:acetyl-CoA carboxylase biotin carboxyl carrier protein
MRKPKQSKKPPAAARAVTTTASGLDLAAIRELALIAGEFGLTEIEADPSGHIRISRRSSPVAADGLDGGAPSGPTIALAPPVAGEGAAAPGTFITSPFVGTFYQAPSPDMEAFVQIGQTVKKGQVVCIVEAMKLMNEIEAESGGKVVEILVKDGEHVEYGQSLIRLSPS